MPVCLFNCCELLCSYMALLNSWYLTRKSF